MGGFTNKNKYFDFRKFHYNWIKNFHGPTPVQTISCNMKEQKFINSFDMLLNLFKCVRIVNFIVNKQPPRQKYLDDSNTIKSFMINVL